MAEQAVADVNAGEVATGIGVNSSVETILEAAGKASEAEDAEGTSTSKTAEEAATGEVDKTQSSEEEVTDEQKAESEEKALLEAGKPIPYERFKSVITNRNQFRDELAQVKKQWDAVIQDPDIARIILKKQGYSDEAIDKELGIENKVNQTDQDAQLEQQLESLAKGLDLATAKGWQMYQFRVAKMVAEQQTRQGIDGYDQHRITQDETREFIRTGEIGATKIAKDTYKIPFGQVGKDESNLNTAVGKISAYLDKNPEDAALGHIKLLHLAMASEGFKSAEIKGAQKEKERQIIIKTAALESEEQILAQDKPDANWSPQQIIAWREKHPDAVI